MVSKASIVALIAVCGAGVWYFWDRTDPLISACDEAIKERLKSPSSYKRLSASRRDERITFDQYFAGRDDGDAVKNLVRSGPEKPERLSALVTYEATNSFNAVIRSDVSCTYDRLGPSDRPRAFAVKIDGLTNTDRTLQELLKSSAAKKK